MKRSSGRLRALTSWFTIAGLVVTGTVAASVAPAVAAPACQVAYTANSWSTGFTASLHITNLGDAWNGWTLDFTFPGNQRITQGWSANWTQAAGSEHVTATNLSWNGQLGANQSTDVGFNASFSGTNTAPASFAINGTTCNGPPPPNQPPTVSLTSPAPGATFTAPATVRLAATAADSDGTVTKVQFNAGTTVLGTVTSSPYTFSWTNVPAGSYSLTATAFDNGGAQTPSAPVGITVSASTTPTLSVSPTTVSVARNGTATVGVALSAAPGGNVTVSTTRASGNAEMAVTAGASLIFTTANWQTPQNVTITATNNPVPNPASATLAVAATGYTTVNVTATEVDAGTSVWNQRFLTLYNKIKDPANGYFSPQGVPYHSVETLIVEAPDYGHQTTSEAFSYWMWLEAEFGKISGDWAPFNNAWAKAEQYIIPSHADQPTNSFYNASKPATYAAEFPSISSYPSPINSSVPVGQDPLASELSATYGTTDIYGMHWLLDVDNRYGYGHCGDATTKPAFINSYQRGSTESVWKTIPQPTCDTFAFGGPNGYLDLFIKDSSYARQWKYTDAPDADARAVQAAYWALVWSTAQGKQAQVANSLGKAVKLGDYLRYAMFDKYFKQIGNCTNAMTCPGASGRGSAHYLLSWYYAWGGALDASAGWAWRIGDGNSHQGYQNPLAAWALSNVAAMAPMSPTAKSDWSTSLARQLQFYQWLQSSDGAIAGGADNSWDGQYGPPPAGATTFYGMAYDVQPVFHDPPSNRWFGFQAWSMERVAEYYFVTGDATAKGILDKWVSWALSNTTFRADGTFQFPSDLAWSGQPAANFNGTGPIAANTGLHVTVQNFTNDVGVAGSYAKLLAYYGKKANSTAAVTAAQNLLNGIWTNDQDAKGVSVTETRTDYNQFGVPLVVPPGWTGKMPNGDPINASSTFTSIRSWYKNDPAYPKVQAYLNGGPAPTFNYHRFWAQADVATALATLGELFG